jgi:hypothetical protein
MFRSDWPFAPERRFSFSSASLDHYNDATLSPARSSTRPFGPSLEYEMKVLVGSGDKIGLFTLPFLIVGLVLNFAYPRATRPARHMHDRAGTPIERLGRAGRAPSWAEYLEAKYAAASSSGASHVDNRLAGTG